MFPPPVLDSLFQDLVPEVSGLPASLLAPRYSHLLQEAIAVSQDRSDSDTSPSGTTSVMDSIPRGKSPKTPVHPPSSIGKRMKGFLFSYLPTLSTTKQDIRQSQVPRPGLPLPPPDVLEKPRGPISTPVRPPAPRPTHPKELVHLQPAPLPKVSMIPRASKPRRLVELHPLPSPTPSRAIAIPRARRSSGGSVKDLVRTFEELDDVRATENRVTKEAQLKRVRSIDWNRRNDKPAWKP